MMMMMLMMMMMIMIMMTLLVMMMMMIALMMMMMLLMADYMNMMGANLPKVATRSTIHSRSVSRTRLQGVGLTSASTPNTPRLAGREASTNSLARSGSTSSGMRRTGGLRSADL